jgi:hypothetical protein
MGATPPRRFVRLAPSRVDKTRFVDVRVTDMAAADALWWDSRIAPRQAHIAARADRLWIWSVLLPMCHLVQLTKRRLCRPLVIWTRAGNGKFVRAGMSILIQRYPYLDVTTFHDSHFVWFISAADSSVLSTHFSVTDPPALGRVLLDNAIVLSQNAGLAGRIGLHAAVAGGPGLLTVYVKCGLLRLPAASPLPSAIHRKNDGRFFYADELIAEALAALLDSTR